MRPALFTSFAVLSALASCTAALAQSKRSRDVAVLENSQTGLDDTIAFLKLAIPCLDLACGAADESLELDIYASPSFDPSRSRLVVHDHAVDIIWTNGLHSSSDTQFALPGSPIERLIHLSWTGEIVTSEQNTSPYQLLHFSLGTTVSLLPETRDPLEETKPFSPLRYSDFTLYLEPNSVPPVLRLMDMTSRVVDQGSEPDHLHVPAELDLAGELESLRLLEHHARLLQAQIAAKKRVISDNVRQHRDKLCVRHLLQECDGVVCAAKVIAHRICDKLGIETDSTAGYMQMKNPHIRHMIALQDQNRKDHLLVSGAVNKHASYRNSELLHLAMVEDDSPGIHNQSTSKSRNAVLHALGVLAAILGLSALFAFVRSKCMSMRTRVERAADREQRRNERAYRRAARRALVRRRWDSFLNTFSCFRSAPCPHQHDYEEKRALILQDAFLEQDVDQLEKGDIMEAEIRELRHAHEIVASLVRVDEHRFELINDPPPPLVALPYTPGNRSRASSGTLPSYSSESLPDYSSRPDRDYPSSPSTASASGSTNSTTDFPLDKKVEFSTSSSPTSSETAPSSDTDHTNSTLATRYTPTSSVRNVSPRPSQETLRTRQSKDT